MLVEWVVQFRHEGKKRERERAMREEREARGTQRREVES